jgi:hypothetical protein
MADTSLVPPAPLSRHQRWAEPSGASTKRVYAMRIRRGIGPAGRAERKRLKRKAARDKFKAAHPNRKQELAAAKAQAAIEASRRSFKLWFGAPLSDKAALAYIQVAVIPDQKQAAVKYLAQIDAACAAVGLNRNRFTLSRGGVQTAIAQRRRAYTFHAKGFQGVEAVKQALMIPDPAGLVSGFEELFQGEAKRIFGNGDSFRSEFEA